MNPGTVAAMVELDQRVVRVGRGLYMLRELLRDGAGPVSMDLDELVLDHLGQVQSELDRKRANHSIDTRSLVDSVRQLDGDFFSG